nr:unnamed protein product [Callosobruchus analis]
MPKINEIITRSSHSKAVLVDFENGKIEPGQESRLKSGLYKDKTGKEFISISSEKVLYTGNLDHDQEYRNFLMVHDEENNTVKLIEVDHCTVSPQIHKENKMLNYSLGAADKSVSELNKQFGSKKAKRATEQRERMTMNIDAVKDQVEKTAEKMNVENAPTQTAQEEDSLCRPKINRDASTRDGVYDLDEVIPNGVLDTLIPQASAVLNSGDSIEEYQLTPFCTDSINKILSLNTPEEIKVRNIAIFFYINYLIKFMNTPFKNITKRYVACDISQEVNRHILDNFCVYTQNGRTRPIHMKDKCLCYIIVLAAIAKEYEVNVALLSKDLKIGLKKAVEVSRILAFNTSSKDKTIVTLNLPLPAPVTFTPKRKVK